MFAHCGLTLVGETEALVLLENYTGSSQAFTALLFVPVHRKKAIRCLGMNCNSFTLGHRTLVKYASGQCNENAAQYLKSVF